MQLFSSKLSCTICLFIIALRLVNMSVVEFSVSFCIYYIIMSPHGQGFTVPLVVPCVYSKSRIWKAFCMCRVHLCRRRVIMS